MNVSHFVKICQVLTILQQLITRGVTSFGTWCILENKLIGYNSTWVKCRPRPQLWSAFYPLTVSRSAHLQVRILHVAVTLIVMCCSTLTNLVGMCISYNFVNVYTKPCKCLLNVYTYMAAINRKQMVFSWTIALQWLMVGSLIKFINPIIAWYCNKS